MSKEKIKIKIEVSPLIYTSGYDENDKMVAIFLSNYPPFEKDTKLARESMPLTNVLEYPDKPSVEVMDLIYLLAKVKGFQRRNLEKFTKELLTKYRLEDRWALSIKMAILTSTLLVPEKSEPIQAIFPSRMKIFLEGINDVAEESVKADLNMRNLISAYKYPLLQFRRKVSKNEIATWLKQNWKEFQSLMQEAPDGDDIRIKDRALVWGQLVSYVFDDNKNITYKEVYNTLQDSFGSDTDVEVPDETILRVYHKRYLKAFQNHIPRQ